MGALVIPPGFRLHRNAIESAAETAGLDSVLVAAVCWQESDFNADAIRFERDFWNRYMKKKPEYAGLNPRRYSSSYGLMQIMWVVAVERGFPTTAPPELLFAPEIGLKWGCRQLKMLFEWAEGLTGDSELVTFAALASYNGGRGGNHPLKDNPLRNASYARKVLAKKAVLDKVYAHARYGQVAPDSAAETQSILGKGEAESKGA